MRTYPAFDFVGFLLLAALFVSLLAAETFRPLRRRVQSRLQRLITNAIIAAPSGLALRLALVPVAVWVARACAAARFGLVYHLPLTPAFQAALAFVLLDYTMYWWHRLNHLVPCFWRFHHVHHTDLDLDLSTAYRFHFGEILCSVAARSLQIALIGVGWKMALAYEVILEAETQFHHSNWRLPLAFERALNLLLVTPRMHGIHHSVEDRQRNANFANIFPWWDRLHRTIELNVSQDTLTIGVPDARNPEDLTASKLLMMPFARRNRG